MHKAVLIRKKSGLLIPEDFLKKAHDEHKGPHSYFGVLTSHEGATVEMSQKDLLPLDTLINLMEEQKESEVLLFLGCSDAEVPANAFQPFSILADKEGFPILSAMVEGTFAGYGKEGQPTPPEFFFLENYLKPKIKQIHGLTKGDLKETVKFLEEETSFKDITSQMTGRGVLVLMTNDGNIKIISKNDQYYDADWGWASNHLGFRMVAGSKEEPKTVSSLLGRKTVNKPVASVPQVNSASTTLHVPVTKKSDGEAKMVDVKPPGQLNNKEVRRWYKAAIGSCPSDWKKRPSVSLPEGFDPLVQSIKDFQTMASRLGVTPLPAEPEKKEEPVVQPEPEKKADTVKNVTPARVKSEQTRPVASTTPVESRPRPILSAEDRVKIKEFRASADYQKIIKQYGPEMSDPKKFKEMEAKLPDFETMAEMDIKERSLWPYELYRNLGKMSLDALATLAFSLSNQNMLLAMKVVDNAPATQPQHTEEDDDNVVEQPKEVAPEPVAVPAGGSLLGRRKRVA